MPWLNRSPRAEPWRARCSMGSRASPDFIRNRDQFIYALGLRTKKEINPLTAGLQGARLVCLGLRLRDGTLLPVYFQAYRGDSDEVNSTKNPPRIVAGGLHRVARIEFDQCTMPDRTSQAQRLERESRGLTPGHGTASSTRWDR